MTDEAASSEAIRTLGDIPRVHARSRPDQTALVYEGTETDFAALDAQSNRLANGLIGLGLRPGTRVAFLDRNSDAYFPILFGAAKAGLVLVTVNFRLTPSEIAYILRDSEAALVFTGAEYAAGVAEARAGLPKLSRTLIIDGPADQPGSLMHLIASASAEPPSVPVRPTDTAIQMYTSGTTGHPKGVELTHSSMVIAAVEGLTVWPAMYRPGASVLATMPLFHIAATNLCLAGLYAGAKAVIVRECTPVETIRIIVEHGITVVPLPATVIHAITHLEGVKALDLSKLDTLLIAGSGIAVELLKAAQETLKCGFALSYGMTECCGGLTYLGPADCRHDAGERLKSAGRVLGNNAVKICDSEGNDLPPGEIGEILCRSDRVMKAYWNRPAETKAAFRDGWYCSGDAGYMDADGYLYVVDRIKDMVISGGENIYPVEIENALIQHPGVFDVAVIGVPDDKWGEALVAHVVAATMPAPDPKAMQDFLRGRLAGYKIPRRYVFVDGFPRNATGKVLKRVMRDQWQGQAAGNPASL